MDIEKFKKLGMTFGAISTIVALFVEIHELWAKKDPKEGYISSE